MRLIIWPYKMGSQGAKALATALGTKRVRSVGAYKYRTGDLIINWGNSNNAPWFTSPMMMLNPPCKVRLAANKLLAFKEMGNVDEEINIPQYCVDKEEAAELFKHSRRVYCRTTLTGHSGSGIVVADSPDALVPAPLYTAGIDGYRDEYRIHVFCSQVIDIQQKKRRKEVENGTDVRNLGNGWVYCRDGVTCPESCAVQAIKCVGALGLSFGAVDLVVKRATPSTPYVLEVNTAAGLEGSTVQAYANAIKELYYD